MESKITVDDIDTVFRLYDKDENGKIENEELHGFLKDLLELVYEVNTVVVAVSSSSSSSSSSISSSVGSHSLDVSSSSSSSSSGVYI